MLDERDKILSKNPTIQEIIESTYSIYKTYWKTSYDYTKTKPQYFSSKPLKNKIKKDLDFIKYTLYVYNIGNALVYDTIKDMDRLLQNEISTVDKEGCYCIYTSVLLTMLLEKYEIKLIQGFYKYNLREDFPNIFNFPKLQVGLHSFAEIDGSVIDFTIHPQQKYTFDFKGVDCILGIIPSGLQLVGFYEPLNVIESYANDFANISNMNLEEWINHHKNNAEIYYQKMIEKIRR